MRRRTCKSLDRIRDHNDIVTIYGSCMSLPLSFFSPSSPPAQRRLHLASLPSGQTGISFLGQPSCGHALAANANALPRLPLEESKVVRDSVREETCSQLLAFCAAGTIKLPLASSNLPPHYHSPIHTCLVEIFILFLCPSHAHTHNTPNNNNPTAYPAIARSRQRPPSTLATICHRLTNTR